MKRIAVTMCMMLVAFLTLAAEPETLTLQSIEVISGKDDKETISVTFTPMKGSEKEALRYAQSFVEARGRRVKMVEETVTKKNNTYSVTIESVPERNVHMAYVKSVGPIDMVGDICVMTVTLQKPLDVFKPSYYDREFANTARSVKIWLYYTEKEFDKKVESGVEAVVENTPEDERQIKRRFISKRMKRP